MADAAIADAPELASVESDDEGVTLVWSDGARGRFLHFWLRENCPEDANSLTGQRLIALLDIPDDIRPNVVSVDGDALRLVWPDGHETLHDGAWLRDRMAPQETTAAPLLDIQTWDASLDPNALVIPYARVADSEAGLFDLIEQIVRYGVVRLQDLPEDDLGPLARCMGRLHDTNYGLFMDIRWEAEAWFRVMAKDAIPPHTDNAYRYAPTGITFFHCLEQIDGPGGESYYVDGLRMADRLRESDPDSFDFLCAAPLTFHRQIPENSSFGVDAAYFRVTAPVFSTNAAGQVTGLRYHPRTVAPFAGDAAETRRMYRARKALEALSLDPSMRIEFQAQPGECAIYDNHRVMHARKDFEAASSGARHFRQCHIDREELHSKWRLLGQELGRPTPEALIAPGVSFH